jgi:hypothetical protein
LSFGVVKESSDKSEKAAELSDEELAGRNRRKGQRGTTEERCGITTLALALWKFGTTIPRHGYGVWDMDMGRHVRLNVDRTEQHESMLI